MLLSWTLLPSSIAEHSIASAQSRSTQGGLHPLEWLTSIGTCKTYVKRHLHVLHQMLHKHQQKRLL